MSCESRHPREAIILGEFHSPWVEKMLQDDQVTSAPRCVRVSMRTAVWIVTVQNIAVSINYLVRIRRQLKGSQVDVLCRHPAMRAPLSG